MMRAIQVIKSTIYIFVSFNFAGFFSGFLSALPRRVVIFGGHSEFLCRRLADIVNLGSQ
jgi:hypothetical protein